MDEMIANRYIGLALKSGDVIYGLDNIKRDLSKIHLIICCKAASSNLYYSLMQISMTNKLPLYQLNDYTLDELLNTSNCKAIGITNPHLAGQIKLVLERE